MGKPYFYRKKHSNYDTQKSIDKSNSFSIDNLPDYGFIGFRLYFYDYCNNLIHSYFQFYN